jgi:integrase/recombinase XerD
MIIRRQQFLDELYSKELANSTIQSYRSDLGDLFLFLERSAILDLSEVKADHLDDYLKSLRVSGLTQSSINRKITTIKGFFKFLISKELINQNPAIDIARRRILREHPEYLTTDELGTLIDHIDLSRPVGQRDRLIIEILYQSGIKIGELIELETTSVIGNKLHVKNRTISISSTLTKLINNYIKNIRPGFNKSDSQKLFLNYKGYQITRQGVWKTLRKYGKNSGLNKTLTSRLLRDSYAINRLRAGANIEDIQQEMGFERKISTHHYLAIIEKEEFYG